VVFVTPTPIVVPYHVYSQGTTYYEPWGDCNGLNAVYAELIRQVAEELAAPLARCL